jgi:UPF0716 protein FxsA
VFGVLLVLFVAVPAAELYVILQAAHTFGVLETVAALLVISAVGAWLCRVEGFSTLRKIQGALNEGRIPTRELQDGALILLAGALLLTPGFLGDVVGILLLLPPTRAVARTFLARVLRGRLQVAAAGAGGPRPFGFTYGGSVVDTDGHDRAERGDRDDGPPGPIPLGP